MLVEQKVIGGIILLLKLKNLILKIFTKEVFYVGSADKLPAPLSKEEEVLYVEKSMNGDEFARAKLIEHNLRLVVFLAKKYENTGIDLEDLVSIGTIGLIKGVNTYKLDKTAPVAGTATFTGTLGSNSWYKALSLKATLSDSHSGVESIKYCTTTSSTCTPSTNINGTTASVTLNGNKSAQKVCYQVTDKSGRTSSVACSNSYSVDSANPSISIASTSVAKNSISVTVNGSDAHSGIYQYKFSSNGGSSYTTVSSTSGSYTYTFKNLKGEKEEHTILLAIQLIIGLSLEDIIGELSE